ncbi:MAG: hypothetical protein ACM3QU_11110 [Verrucomicrobiota bacterium]
MIAEEAAAESPLWGESLLPAAERDPVPVFSPLLSDARFAVGLETIYEGYLLHYGRPRLFAAGDDRNALLLGDYLYAHGLVRVAEHQDVDVVGDLAALISFCAQLRADGGAGDGEAWAATAALIGRGPLSGDRGSAALVSAAREAVGAEAVDLALVVHAGRVG